MRDEKETVPLSPQPVVYGEGPINTIIDNNGSTTGISSQSSKDALWPLLNDIPLSQGLDMDRQSNDIQILFRGEIKAVVNERGHFDPKSGLSLDADYWGFDPPEDMDLWTACIIAEAAIAKANRLQYGLNKQKSARQVIQTNDNTHTVNRAVIPLIPAIRKRGVETMATIPNHLSLQEQFHQERKRQAKFESLEEAKIAQDVATTLSGIIKQDAKDADMLAFQLQPIQRQKLFDEIAWDGANVVFPVPSAEAALPEERGGLIRKALESACAVNQGIAGLIHDIARNRTQNLVSKLCKIWEASLQTVGDAYKERESRLRGVQMVPEAQDALSKTYRQKFIRKKLAKSIVGN
ncbi:MAG: hypothetical protein EZS28_043016 [Streblomastix strix]|uniref:Uncharacterized protein n=1 Tax=Streblomastix strix TaxID=222440 RepID=A0A5J4TT87_9EUKA|nr:MAG: hypothetical protein EZS28_043016 [Streblomastix strix]